MHDLGLSCPFPDPILLKVGPFAVSWYGLLYCAAAVAWYLVTRSELIRRQGPIPVAGLPEFLFHGLVGGIIGARLGFVLVYDLPYFIESPWEIFAFWHGGMSAHGWLVGMAIGGLLFIREHKLPVRELADIAYLGLPLGLMLVKIGNFINCEGFGKITTLPWGVVCGAPGSLPRHPVQLYEALLEGLLLFAILWRVRLVTLRPGDISCFFLIGYGTLRFMIEFCREPVPSSGLAFGWLNVAQVFSLAAIAIGLIGYALQRRTTERLNYRTGHSKSTPLKSHPPGQDSTLKSN
jgi:phosphatidylglycerol---prolipoprotein diacylglyceryl transferase